MAILQLLSVKCTNREDTLGKDEPFIKVAGRTVWAGQGFTRGTSRSLESVAAQPFSNSVSVEMWENDAPPNADDFIGSHSVSAAEAGTGPRVATFNEHGAIYEVTYRVD